MAQLSRGKRSSVPIDSSSVMAGNRFFGRNVLVNYITPDWDRVKFPTVVKVLPPIEGTKDQKAFQPYRHDTGETGFNDWFAVLPVAQFIGTSQDKQSFLLYDPIDEDYNVQDNPYIFMYNKLKRLAKERREVRTSYRTFHTSELVSLFDNTVTRDTIAFSKPNKRMMFVNVIPVFHRDKLQMSQQGAQNTLMGCTEGDRPTVMGLSPSAAKVLLNLANIESDTSSDDLNEMYHFGDFTAVEGGKFLGLYKEDLFSEAFLSGAAGGGSSAQEEFDNFDEANQRERSFVGYGGCLLDVFSGPHPKRPGSKMRYSHDKLIASHSDAILKNYSWIGEYFNLPTHEEIVKYLVMAFKPNPEYLEVGLADTEYMTDEIRGMLGNRKQVAASSGNSKAGKAVEEDDDGIFGGDDIDDSVPFDTDDAYEDAELAPAPKSVGGKTTSKPATSKRNVVEEEDADETGGMPMDSDDDLALGDEDVDFNEMAGDFAEEEEEAAPAPRQTQAKSTKPSQTKPPASQGSSTKAAPAGKSTAKAPAGKLSQQSGKATQKARSVGSLMNGETDDDLPYGDN